MSHGGNLETLRYIRKRIVASKERGWKRRDAELKPLKPGRPGRIDLLSEKNRIRRLCRGNE